MLMTISSATEDVSTAPDTSVAGLEIVTLSATDPLSTSADRAAGGFDIVTLSATEDVSTIPESAAGGLLIVTASATDTFSFTYTIGCHTESSGLGVNMYDWIAEASI